MGADVNPRPCRHLAVHRETERVEPAELVPCRPPGYQVCIRDEHAGSFVVSPEDSDRLSALYQKCFVVFQAAERAYDPFVARPIAGRFPTPTVDDQLLRTLGDCGIEIVHQHPKRRLLMPPLAGEGGTGGGGDRGVGGGCGHGGYGLWAMAIGYGYGYGYGYGPKR